AEVTDVDDDTLAGVIEQAISAQLLREAPGGRSMRFTHALVRESIYDSIVLPRRRMWHRTIGERLAAHPDAEPDTVAHHFQQARDPQAATWLMEAGERAARSNAVQDAVDRFEQALHLLEAQGDDNRLDDRAWLLSNLAGAYRYTDPPLALEYLDHARLLLDRSTGPALAAIVLWSRARIRGFLGEDTREDMDQAIAAYNALTPEDWQRVRTLGRGVAGSQGALSQWLAHHGRYADALRIGLDCVADQHHQGAVRTPYHQTEVGHAMLGIALSQAGLGRPDDAREAFVMAKQHFGGAWHYFMAAAAVKWEEIDLVMTYHADDIAWRDRLAGEYERIWLQTTRFPAYATNASNRTFLPLYPPLIVAGRWAEVVEAASAYLGDTYLRVDALAALAEIERARGQYTSAWQHVHQGIPDGPATAPGTPFFVRTLVLQRLAAELALDEHQLGHAMEWIEAHDRWLEWSGRVLDRAATLLLRACHALVASNLTSACDLATRAITEAEHPRQPLALLAAHRMTGHLTTLLGRYDEATAHLRIASSLADACAAPYERALTLIEQAALLHATDQAADASPLLADARATCEALSAAPALSRIAELEAKNPRHRTVSTGDLTINLSPRELEVLQLVARGLTDAEVADRLFISPRTVARHLQSVYNKLGVSSRTAASAFAFEHGLVPVGDA
ncbi:MAG: LuxR C-terminal-related transcriptional regulator, partial [Chloroflexota bacterium]|nr:LuxR C-terminal-related transcriptional regulator [Chloroflexota bacterium]